MKVVTISNGSMQMLVSPENEMEEAFLNMLMKQDNDITVVDRQIPVIDKMYDKGVIIGSKLNGQKG